MEEFLILSPMAIITLTSDWGLRDYFMASFKGKILDRLPEVNIVDISHEVSPFNLMQASFIIRNTCFHFPPGTVHVISLLTEPSRETPHLVVKYNGHYFIAADNGIFSLVFDRPAEQVISITRDGGPGHVAMPARERFVEAAIHLASGKPVEQLGPAVSGWKEQLHFLPVVSGDVIRGVVIYVNHYENVVTNITRDVFEKVGQGRKFAIEFRGDTIRHLSQSYREVPVGEIVALFGSTGHLEIAINQGNASSLLGLEVNDPVRVEFSQ